MLVNHSIQKRLDFGQELTISIVGVRRERVAKEQWLVESLGLGNLDGLLIYVS